MVSPIHIAAISSRRRRKRRCPRCGRAALPRTGYCMICRRSIRALDGASLDPYASEPVKPAPRCRLFALLRGFAVRLSIWIRQVVHMEKKK